MICSITLEAKPIVSSSCCFPDWKTTAKILGLELASYLVVPFFKIRENFYTFYILNKIYETKIQKIVKTTSLIFGIIGSALLLPFTMPVGIPLRGLITTFESKPYVYVEKSECGKSLPTDRKLTLVSHNQCYVTGGFSITDGHVTPPSDGKRMQANIEKIKQLDPHVVCLFEVAEAYQASDLSSQLSEYPYIIPIAGTRAIGVSSMIYTPRDSKVGFGCEVIPDFETCLHRTCDSTGAASAPASPGSNSRRPLCQIPTFESLCVYVASKYKIDKDSIEFTPFIKERELTGRASYSEKGVLSFDLLSQGEETPFATIVPTHLQHSEIPAQPTEEEKKARGLQMQRVPEKVKQKIEKTGAVIFTGDLNLEEADHIATKMIDTGYSGLEFRPEATSDHNLLFSTITLLR